jgi:hypothetical protein
MGATDIERSPVVAKVLEIFEGKHPNVGQSAVGTLLHERLREYEMQPHHEDAAIIPKKDVSKNNPLWW